MQETQVHFLGQEDPLEKGKATHSSILGLLSGSDSKESTCNAEDLGLIPGLGGSPGEGNGNPPQYFCLGNPMETSICQLIRHFVIPWTVTWQTTLFMEFSSQEHWSGWPFSSPGDLPNPGIEAGSPALWTDS